MVETKRFFFLVGGDNTAEACSGNIKKCMRRLGLLSSADSSEAEAAVDVLAAQRLSMKPGLESVLESVAYFRSQRSGVVAPMAAFEDLSWLKWV